MINFILVYFEDLDETLSGLEKNENFPTIDTEALLSILLEIFLINVNVKPENAIQYVMHADLLNDKIVMDENDFVKLEAIIYKLLLIIRDKLLDVFLTTDESLKYAYVKRKGNIVILKKCN